MLRRCILLPLLLLPGAAYAADISGTWSIDGPIKPVCTFVQSGNNLNGACRGPGAEGPLTGSVDGQQVHWTFTRKNLTTGQPVAPVNFTASLNGASLSGTMQQDNGNLAPFTAQIQPGAEPIRLASAAAPPPPVAPPAAAASPALNNTPPRTVFDIDVDGSATHRQTGMVCPGASGIMKRNQIIMYDKVGFDVSCNYQAAGADITIYLTMRDPSLLQQDFASAKQALVTRTPSAVPDTDMLLAPPGLQWLQAAYDENGGAVRSEVLYAQLSGWEYEIRVTFRPDNAGMVATAMADLTQTVRRTAGTHLAACQADGRRTDGKGQRNQNLDVLQALAASAATVTKVTVTTPASDAVWCPDIGFGIGAGDYVWWHNITPTDRGPVDRITAIKGDVGRTIFVVRVPADINKAVAEKLGGTASLGGGDTYALVVDETVSTRIAGIFNDRPSFNDVTGLVLERPFGVYAEIKKPDGNISVYKPF